MALTEGDKAICMEIARTIVKEVLEQHVEACPYGKRMAAGKMFVVGLCTGCAAIGSGVGTLIGMLSRVI